MLVSYSRVPRIVTTLGLLTWKSYAAPINDSFHSVEHTVSSSRYEVNLWQICSRLVTFFFFAWIGNPVKSEDVSVYLSMLSLPWATSRVQVGTSHVRGCRRCDDALDSCIYVAVVAPLRYHSLLLPMWPFAASNCAKMFFGNMVHCIYVFVCLCFGVCTRMCRFMGTRVRKHGRG